MNNTNAGITHNPPSIGSSATLVELNISVWTGRKQDKGAADAVAHENAAKAGTVTVNKNLLAGCEELADIQKLAGEARLAHHGFTLPWSDQGARLLPTTKYFDYLNYFSDRQARFEKLVDNLVSVYSLRVAEAQANLGALFVADEYPDADEIARKFAFRYVFSPVPDVGDWRVDLGRDALSDLAEQYSRHYQSKLEETKAHTWEIVRAAMDAMLDRLADPGEGERATKQGTRIFKDSLVSNMLDAVDKLAAFNITNDPSMADMRARLQQIMDGVTPEALREDATLRKDTRDAVTKAIAALPSLGW